MFYLRNAWYVAAWSDEVKVDALFYSTRTSCYCAVRSRKVLFGQTAQTTR
jgi:hypothetical protein